MKGSAQAENNNKEEFTVQSQETATEKCRNTGKEIVNGMDSGISAVEFSVVMLSKESSKGDF